MYIRNNLVLKKNSYLLSPQKHLLLFCRFCSVKSSQRLTLCLFFLLLLHFGNIRFAPCVERSLPRFVILCGAVQILPTHLVSITKSKQRMHLILLFRIENILHSLNKVSITKSKQNLTSSCCWKYLKQFWKKKDKKILLTHLVSITKSKQRMHVVLLLKISCSVLKKDRR